MGRRRAAKVDRNQASIVERFRALGWSVQPLHTVGAGVPDLLVSGILSGGELMGCRMTYPVEVKAEQGTLTKDQKHWFALWRAPVFIVRTFEDVEALIRGELVPVHIESM
jgi:hypothetical protein